MVYHTRYNDLLILRSIETLLRARKSTRHGNEISGDIKL